MSASTLTRRPLADQAAAAARSPEQLAATIAVFTLGLRYDVHLGMTFGVLVAVLLLPVWYQAFGLYRGGRAMAGGLVLVMLNGLALAGFSRSTHVVDSHELSAQVMMVVEVLAGTGVILWARRVLPVWAVGAAFGLGMCAWAVVHPSAGGNPWKFDLAIPVGVLLLALASRSRRAAWPILAMVLLAAVSVVFDSRAYSAALLLCAVLYLWRALPQLRRTRHGWVGVSVMVAGVGAALYFLVSALLVNGWLGTAAALRTQSQIETSGSLILGGRPEIAATWALLRYQPWGYGPGVSPAFRDILVAKSGMATINYDPNNGYVDNYMLGGHFELHSVFGDLWASYGIAGLALALAAVLLAGYAVARGIATRSGSAVLFFAAVWTLWNVPFSPLVVSVPILSLLFGLVLRPRTAVGEPRGGG